MSSFTSKLLNIILYQTGWFCCVLGAAWGYPVRGALGALLLVGIHLLLARSPENEINRMLAACLIGISVDSIQQWLGIFSFKTDPVWPFWLPLWVFVIWAQFATLLRYALFWLSGRYLPAALFGMLGGPLAYWGGIRLGAAAFGEQQLVSLISLAIVWSIVMPTLLWISDRLGDEEGRYRGFGSKS